jgi:hypothetical protein
MKVSKKKLIGLIKEALKGRPVPTTGNPADDKQILMWMQSKGVIDTEEIETNIRQGDSLAEMLGYPAGRSFAIDYRDWVIDQVSLALPSGSDILQGIVEYGQGEGGVRLVANVKEALEAYGIQGLTMDEYQEYSAIWAELIWANPHNLLFLRPMP